MNTLTIFVLALIVLLIFCIIKARLYAINQTKKSYIRAYDNIFSAITSANLISQHKELLNVLLTKLKLNKKDKYSQFLIYSPFLNCLVYDYYNVARYGNLHKKYGEHIANVLYRKIITVGMSKDMLIDSIGKPLNTESTQKKVKLGVITEEKYIYGTSKQYNDWYVLENGIITEIKIKK